MQKKTKSYIIGILIPVVVGALSALLTRNNMDIYESIAKPDLAPPAILFPIVWTVLYVLMGIGSVIIYNSNADTNDKTRALLFYALQLIFNFFWSILFFRFSLYGFAFLWLLALIGFIVIMIYMFSKIKPVAAYLQIPYLLWCLFAAYLNGMVLFMN